MNEIYQVKTSIGKFRVEKTETHLKVGAKRFCVEIRFGKSQRSELQWLITKDGGCELDDKPIQGSHTVHMLNLSFTLLKRYTDTTHLTFLDNSKFDCSFHDGSKITIFMNKYNYLFHGGTWYDTKMNATPIDPIQTSLYEETKALYIDPSVKQPFDFRNPLLQAELSPIYDEVKTWKEFADALHKKYTKEILCRKISPWYSYAVAILTKNRMLPEYWSIDITDLTDVPFTRVPVSQRGGRTRRQYSLYNGDYTMSPSEIYNKII
jgi:hypothetical protein